MYLFILKKVAQGNFYDLKLETFSYYSNGIIYIIPLWNQRFMFSVFPNGWTILWLGLDHKKNYVQYGSGFFIRHTDTNYYRISDITHKYKIYGVMRARSINL